MRTRIVGACPKGSRFLIAAAQTDRGSGMSVPVMKRTRMEDGENGVVPEMYPHFATQAIHAGQDPDSGSRGRSFRSSLCPPPSNRTLQENHFLMSTRRGGNPTRTVFEACIASLEAAKYAISTSSGLAAQSTIVQTLKSGDHIVSMGDVYGGTHRQFRLIVSKLGIETTYVDATDLSQVEEAIRETTKVVWVESCTNPLLRIINIPALVKLVKSKNKDIIVVVDNTFMTPYFARPLDMGADVVLHSVTKYLNGHSDVLMGVLCLNDEELEKKLRFIQFAVGMVPSPFDCYLANRGLKTLHLRMREHQRNATAMAQLLSTSPHVTETIYPGLPSHPQHEVATETFKGYGGMVSFRIKGGLEQSQKFMQAVKVFTLAESLGGYESLVDLPSVMTHASIPAEDREKMGITDSLIRLSVGLEDTQDLLDDVTQALEVSQV